MTGARRPAIAVAAVLTLLAGCSGGGPPPVSERIDQTSPGGVRLTQVATAVAPAAGVAGPGGTLWIAERGGTVRVLDGDRLSDPVLDISAETTTDGERGLLGIAFDHDFAHLYLSYTDLAGDTVIAQMAVSGDQPLPGTRRVLLTQEQPFANHNGGDLAIGPDGMLYIGLGDGGSGGDPLDSGQDLGTLLGALLRIDPDGDPYAVPPDNPFVGDPSARDEIWVYGLRNPWRFSFDAQTGDLWIGDVGQSAREEVDVVPAGSGGGHNFGWARMEGTRPYDGAEPADHIPPVFDYPTDRGRCSITGGYVYRGTAIPDLVGSYLFSDFCDGTIRALRMSDGEVVGEADLGVDGGAVAAFAQGPDRELYVLDLGGAVYLLEPEER